MCCTVLLSDAAHRCCCRRFGEVWLLALLQSTQEVEAVDSVFRRAAEVDLPVPSMSSVS